MNGPDIDTGRPFRLPRDIAELGIAGIEPAVDQPARALMRQRQYGEKAFALWGCNIEPVSPCDRPKRIRIMIGDRLEHLVRCQAGNILARSIHQRGDARGIDREDDRTPCQLQRGHPVERVRRRSALRGASAGGFAQKFEVERGHDVVSWL